MTELATHGTRRVYPPLVPSRGFSRETRETRGTLAALLVLLCACSGPGSDAGGRATAPLEPTQRDSAGIALLEHPGNALDRAPLITIDSVPLAVFAESADDPSQDVSRLYPQLFTGAGEFVGFDYSQLTLLVLDPASGQRRRLGRGGAGPNELGRSLSIRVVAHDTLIIGDASNARIAIGHTDTGVIRTQTLANVREIQSARLIGQTSDGLVLMKRMGITRFKGGVATNGPTQLIASAMTWRPGIDSLAVRFDVPEYWMIVRVTGPGSWAGVGLPLAASPELLAWRDEFLVAVAERWQLERHDTSGVLRTVIRINRATQSVDDAIYQRYVDGTVAVELARNPEADTAATRAEVATGEHAATLPAFAETRVTPNGTVWVMDFRFPGDSGWAATAVHHDGRILGRIVEASGNPPIAFGDDRLAFRTEDDDGIATLTIRRIHFR